MKFTPELQKILIETSDYREFLQKIFATFPGLSYSALAVRAGFSSRSYPREVVTGRRRITARTLPQFIRALRLTGDLKNYFSTLVAKSEPDLNVQNLSEAEIENRLTELRMRILKRGDSADSIDVLRSETFLEIYAALGTKEEGHLIDEIQAMTHLSEEECKQHLKQMCEDGVVEYRNGTGRFAPTGMHLSFQGLGGSEFFKKYYLNLSREMNQRAVHHFESDNNLYFASVFSVSAEKAPQFKRELRKLMLQFVDEAENSKGDVLGRLTVAFEGAGK